MQVLSVRGDGLLIRNKFLGCPSNAETDSNNTAFQGHPRLKPSLPPARAAIEGSARDPQRPTAIAPTDTKPRRNVVVGRP